MKRFISSIVFVLLAVTVLWASGSFHSANTTVTNSTTTYAQRYPDQIGGVPFIFSTDKVLNSGTYDTAAAYFTFDVPLQSISGGISRWCDIYYNRGSTGASNVDTTSVNETIYAYFGLDCGGFKVFQSDSVLIATAGNEGNAFSTQAGKEWSFSSVIGTTRYAGGLTGGVASLVDSICASKTDTNAATGGSAGITRNITYLGKPFNVIRFSVLRAAIGTGGHLSQKAHLRLAVIAYPGMPATVIREPHFPSTSK